MPRILGSVPYLNAKPLLYALPPAFEVRLAPPAELAGRFARYEFEAALLPIIDAFRTPGARIVRPYCIAARGDVLSVRLFLDRPLSECRTLARDPASHTSNALLEVLSQLKWKRALPPPPPGVKPDGRLLIGDAALRALGTAAHEVDLAGEWHAWTGLPFVFAAWITKSPKPGLAEALAASGRTGLVRRDVTADAEAVTLGFDRMLCRRYLRDSIAYDLDADAVRGAELFWRHAASVDLAPPPHALQVLPG